MWWLVIYWSPTDHVIDIMDQLLTTLLTSLTCTLFPTSWHYFRLDYSSSEERRCFWGRWLLPWSTDPANGAAADNERCMHLVITENLADTNEYNWYQYQYQGPSICSFSRKLQLFYAERNFWATWKCSEHDEGKTPEGNGWVSQAAETLCNSGSFWRSSGPTLFSLCCSPAGWIQGPHGYHHALSQDATHCVRHQLP